MPRALRIPLVTAFIALSTGTLAAQTTALSPSPTLPSDTLEANYGPRSAPAPMPELAPSLPSDTLDATQPVDSFPAAPPGGNSSTNQARPDDLLPDATPHTPGDSAALRELKTWIRRHPGLTAPPPVRAVLVRV